ncbi:hypothetical protein EXIGLDRAFT_87093 [Exidia glandulosa HHB12029]|uniref:Uncharacterized protein n=1 Tax=Exidia glandulosa HHB12029 TaxID=1314781 RepID=A0A165HD04_EXIGL|nr:hypothetical protein EXIGLDRAFT_87093 [Exidia glandulosa HHB12029]
MNYQRPTPILRCQHCGLHRLKDQAYGRYHALFLCVLCNGEHHCAIALRRHMHRVHGDPNSAAPIGCITCNASFTQIEWSRVFHAHGILMACYHRTRYACFHRHLHDCESCRRVDASRY